MLLGALGHRVDAIRPHRLCQLSNSILNTTTIQVINLLRATKSLDRNGRVMTSALLPLSRCLILYCPVLALGTCTTCSGVTRLDHALTQVNLDILIAVALVDLSHLFLLCIHLLLQGDDLLRPIETHTLARRKLLRLVGATTPGRRQSAIAEAAGTALWNVAKSLWHLVLRCHLRRAKASS